jgi:hypothetical protein
MDTQVHTSKSGGIVITNPSFGRTGWRGGEEVVYDSKSLPPRWLTLAEFKVAKELRSQAWKRTKGPELFRLKRLQDDERFFGRQVIDYCEDPAPEGEHPDPIPTAARPRTEAVRPRRKHLEEGPTEDGSPRRPKQGEGDGRAHFGAILTRAYVPG